MPAVIFETPGLIDIRAFTTFGFNAKPATDNPIGYFGTGLKYAIAVLAREDIPVQLFIGDVEYRFNKEHTSFRGKDFDVIRMRKRSGWRLPWQQETLPFTTELGKNWELWQAFRELEANTRDEGGRSDLLSQEPQEGIREEYTSDTHTVFCISGERFAEEWRTRDKTFLPEHDPNFIGNVQIVKRPSKHLYYRGMRVADLKTPSIYTYNIRRWLELTEDRTIKWMFSALATIAEAIAKSSDEQLISSVVKASQDHMESRLEWTLVGVAPSPTFIDVVHKLKQRGHSNINSGAERYYRTYAPRPHIDPYVNESYRDKIVRYVKEGEFDMLTELIDSDREKFIMLLGKDDDNIDTATKDGRDTSTDTPMARAAAESGDIRSDEQLNTADVPF